MCEVKISFRVWYSRLLL